jgi:uncharacterized protein (DUF1778 family)
MKHLPERSEKAKRKMVNIKYPSKSLALLDKAVKLSHYSDRTKYILDAVNRAVENDLLDRRDFFLSEEDFQAFEKMLNAPPRSIKALQDLFKEKAPWEK